MDRESRLWATSGGIQPQSDIRRFARSNWHLVNFLWQLRNVLGELQLSARACFCELPPRFRRLAHSRTRHLVPARAGRGNALGRAAVAQAMNGVNGGCGPFKPGAATGHQSRSYFNKSRTRSRSSFSSLSVASILPRLKSLTASPFTMSSFWPLLRTGKELIKPASVP